MMILRCVMGMMKPSTRLTIKYGDKVVVRGKILCDISWMEVNEYQDYYVESCDVVDGGILLCITMPGYRRG